MKRRSFVKASLLTGTSIAAMPAAAKLLPAQSAPAQELYELRVYTLQSAQQQKLVEDYFKTAAIPAYNRLGSKAVGLFTELKPEGQSKLYAIIPFASVADYLTADQKLSSDAAYVKAAAPYLNATATAPAYQRIESWLLKAFTGMPKLEAPPKKPRIFELRRYESPSEVTGQKKIEMFNEGGEIGIFKRVGLTPVFFGETLIGSLRPNLTYMITFDDMAEHDKNWKTFIADAEWKKLSGLPEYANDRILSNITNVFLVPTAFSQI